MILTAGSGTASAGAALEKLCRNYWPPLLGFALRSGLSREAAEDAVQGFIMIVIERGSLATVEPGGALFRSWLLAGFVHHLQNTKRQENAVKRGGGVAPLSLEMLAEYECCLPVSAGLTPAEAFDQGWARLIMTNTLEKLRKEQARAGKCSLYEVLEPVVTGQARTNYADLATATGMSENNVSVSVHRLRTRLRDILRAEVAQTVTSADSLEEELRYLMEVLQRC